MSKFYVGQKVRCVISELGAQVGMIYEVSEINTLEQERFFRFKGEDGGESCFMCVKNFQPINETPETLTINGVEYIRKPEPVVEHEWKFGDVAVHEKFGVGIVTREIDEDGKVGFGIGKRQYFYWVKPSTLTFIRRADLSA